MRPILGESNLMKRNREFEGFHLLLCFVWVDDFLG